MKITPTAKIVGGQDGTVWGRYLFRFGKKGDCWVYDLADISGEGIAEPRAVAEFTLDRAEEMMPHSNAVVFGNEYCCEGDEFPLLYSNIYNTYSKEENKRKGICCVYRLQREDNVFTTKLMQLIEIGFVEDPRYWRSENGTDVRPYGNFVVDREKSVYYAYTMRDETHTTRYFAFDLPKLKDGTPDAEFGVNRVVLTPEDIRFQFDCEYHRYVQGGCVHEGKIYSLEGFTEDEKRPPALRIIDPEERRQQEMFLFADYGLTVEPEMIEFADGICYYCDHSGNLYTLEF